MIKGIKHMVALKQLTYHFRCEVLGYEKLFMQGQIEGMVRTEIDKQKAVCGGKNRNFTSLGRREVIFLSAVHVNTTMTFIALFAVPEHLFCI